MPFIVKNNIAGSIKVGKFGILLAQGEQRDLLDIFSLVDIADDKVLPIQISNHDIIINDGTQDLSVADAIRAATVESKKEDEENDSVSGGWHVGATAPASPTTGTGWYKTSDNILYIYDAGREKWLSNTHQYALYASGKLRGAYMTSGTAGYKLGGLTAPSNLTIVGLCIKTNSGNTNKAVQLEIEQTTVATIYVVNYVYKNMALNIDVDEDDIFQIFVSTTGGKIRDMKADILWSFRS